MDERVSEYQVFLSLSGEVDTLVGQREDITFICPLGIRFTDMDTVRGHWTVVLMILSLGCNYLHFSCEYV